MDVGMLRCLAFCSLLMQLRGAANAENKKFNFCKCGTNHSNPKARELRACEYGKVPAKEKVRS